MAKYIIAYDLGTGGNKASLYDNKGKCLAESFVPYPTYYPAPGWHEQNPQDWWQAIVQSTRKTIAAAGISPQNISCCGISGHSLGVVPLDKQGNLLRQGTPIWSDSRPDRQVPEFFQTIDPEQWYMTTGNGFPPALYSVFKLMWYRDNEPEMFGKIHKAIGTKDYINYRLTGKMVTDYSYASGSGVYDLVKWQYSPELIKASGLPQEIFPEIVPSTEVIGSLTAEAAKELNLPQNVQVVAGGVDNSCMALGAGAFRQGRVYNSQGTSSWIAISSNKPLLNAQTKPYVFTHVVPGMFASATAIFSAGNSFRWLRDNLCQDLIQQGQRENCDAYELMTALAESSPVGARKLLFNPSLAGGSSLDPSPIVRGAFLGLDLGHNRSDIIRSAMEGIALGLGIALDELRKLVAVSDQMIVVGGASRSKLWRQIYADVYGMKIVKTNIDQQAAALGAAALAAVGTGLWQDFAIIDNIHQVQSITEPIPSNQNRYQQLLKIYRQSLGNLVDFQEQINCLQDN